MNLLLELADFGQIGSDTLNGHGVLIDGAFKSAEREQAILEAQRYDAMPLIGEPLFWTLHGDPAEAKAVALLNPTFYQDAEGSTYENPGLRSVIRLFAYARMVEASVVKLAADGPTRSPRGRGRSAPTREAVKAEAARARNMATTQFRQVERFLCERAEDYPEYCPAKTTQRTGVRMIGKERQSWQ